jgi:hypothetical protein
MKLGVSLKEDYTLMVLKTKLLRIFGPKKATEK